MAFKKKLPGGSHYEADLGSRDQLGSSLNNVGHEHPSIFLETYLTNVNYKTDHAFDFESYKSKIVKGLEIFGEDITNLKSNMNHLFSITDFHVYKDFYDITNELVAIAQMKLEGLITKSSSDAKNYNEQDVSEKIMHKLNITNYRKDIKNHISHLRDHIAEYLNDDKNYRRTNFATSDLTLLLEKAFKLYDVFESESGLVNFLKVDELSLYNKMFHNHPDVSYPDLITLNVPALTERLGPGRIYRTPAAFTKERLLFRIDEIINDKMPKITLTSVSTFVKTQLLREKYNLKNNLIAIFQKVLPEGLKLTDNVEKIKKEILEELHALREGIAYLESHNKSYIKILTGNLHPDMVANLSFNTPNVDILIDIEKLFFIIDDITSRLAEVLKKIKHFRDLESESIEGAVSKAVEQITEHIDKISKERTDAHGLIEGVFKELEELIEKERVSRQQYNSEKSRIDEERRQLETNMEKKIEEKRNNIMETKGPASYNIEASRAPVETREAHQYQPRREEDRTVKTDAYKPYESEKNAKVESNIIKPKTTVPEVPAKKEEPKVSTYDTYNKPSPYDAYNKPSTFDTYNKPATTLGTTPPKEEKKPLTLAAPAATTNTANTGFGSGLKLPATEEKKPISGGFGGLSDKKNTGYDEVKKETKIEPKIEPKKEEPPKKAEQKSKNFFDDIEDEIEDIDNIMEAQKKTTTLPPAKNTLAPIKNEPVKELPKKVEPKKEEKKGPAKWDFDDMEEEIIEDEPAYKPGKPEPVSKLPEPKKGGLEPLPALGGAGVNKLAPLAPIGGTKVEEKPAPAKTSAVDKLFNKLEGAQDTKKKVEEKKKDDFDDEDYDYEFDSDTEKKTSPKKESPVKPAAVPEKKKDSPEAKPAPQGPVLNPVVTAEKLELVNEHIEQEAELYAQAINPEALNDLDMLIMLFQEFFSQLKLFVFDYQETDLILGETKEDLKGFKKNSVAKNTIKEIAEVLKKYYLEMLPTETQIHENSRFFVPLAAQEEGIPFLVEVDLEHQAFTYMYFGDVPKDKDSDNFLKELHSLFKDIINNLFDNKILKRVDACTSHKIGLDQSSQATIGPFEGAAYIRVMLMIFYLVYETDKVSKNVTISIDQGMLNRFFCTLTSLVYLRRILEGNVWDQYSEHYLAMSEQLSDGQEVLVKYLPFESTGTDYPMVQKKIEKELQGIFSEVKGGLKEAFLAVHVAQPDLMSVYYLYLASEFEPKVPKKDYKAILFGLTANDAEFDPKMEKIVKDLDKSGKTDVVMYKDYLRHNLNYQFPNVALGSWIMLTKQNQFSPEESMLLLVYNMNGFHLNVQTEEEGEGEEGEEEANYGQAHRGGPGGHAGQQDEGEEDYGEDFDELPIEDIEDDF